MQRIFIPPDQFQQDDTACILGQDHQHLIRVMRARIGESIMLLESRSSLAFRATIVAIDRDRTLARIVEQIPMPPEPWIFLAVAQALGKGDKFEQVIQHCTEAGASAFVPIRPARCVVDIPANRITERVARWNLIAKGAAEQSGRTRIPDISEPTDWRDFVKCACATRTPCLLLHAESPAVSLRTVLERCKFPESRALSLLIGPEGGWRPDELEFAEEAGCELVSLGPRILRTETAAIVAISQILYHFQETGEP